MTLPCFSCGKQLASALPIECGDRNQPSEGTAFTTAGHYGSGVFDPMDGAMLELNICDECLTARPERARLLRMTGTVETAASPWLPSALPKAEQRPASMLQPVNLDMSPKPEDQLVIVRFVPVDETEDEW